jgi:tetratricopeptide (TPR) repeat protein
MCFSELVQKDQRLAALRQLYAHKTAEERRAAADWAYHAACATGFFDRAMARLGEGPSSPPTWPPGVEALAIDPAFAPALLTVGSIEHQCGRQAEARVLFHALLKLPPAEPDLEAILDKAGEFWLDEGEFEEARDFYDQACRIFTKNTELLDGLGCSLAKLGRLDEAVAVQSQALALDPRNPHLLSDLGWALTENRQFEEAETVLKEAVRVAPADYSRPQANLAELRRRRDAAKRQARSGR